MLEGDLQCGEVLGVRVNISACVPAFVCASVSVHVYACQCVHRLANVCVCAGPCAVCGGGQQQSD